MFDFIFIYIISALILVEISVIYHEKSWSNKALKISFIPIINTAYIIVGLSIVIGLNLYKFIDGLFKNLKLIVEVPTPLEIYKSVLLIL